MNKQQQSLNSKQQALLNDYADQMRQFMPEVAGVALEASSLALEAVSDVTGALLENKPKAAERLQGRINEIIGEIKQHVSEEHLASSKLEDYFENQEFEEEFEIIIKDMVVELVQANIGNMIAAAMRGDDEEVKAFEKRMEQFGKDMEQKFESRAEELEQKADKLCQLAKQLERSEERFIEQFEAYKDYELL